MCVQLAQWLRRKLGRAGTERWCARGGPATAACVLRRRRFALGMASTHTVESIHPRESPAGRRAQPGCRVL
eukprot:79634-Prymnesium_polylepis.2